jgi:SAM-dependent methyltransferase
MKPTGANGAKNADRDANGAASAKRDKGSSGADPTRPAFLNPRVASAFQDASVVRAYPKRAPYPDELFLLLAGLIAGERRVVLDVGAGTGDVARRLAQVAPLVERVDAVDWSPAMIALGRQLPGGDDSRLRWITGRAEEAPLDSPYGLVTAGESLHWMDWAVVLPRFAAALAPGGLLAIVGRDYRSVPWGAEQLALIRRYSTNPDYVAVDLIAELSRRGLFTQSGEWQSEPFAFTQSVEDYIEALHSTSSFSRERMASADVVAFDEALRALLGSHAVDGRVVTSRVVGHAVWGTPHAV